MFAQTLEPIRKGERPHPLLNGAEAWNDPPRCTRLAKPGSSGSEGDAGPRGLRVTSFGGSAA
jgi:hypothetical protein